MNDPVRQSSIEVSKAASPDDVKSFLLSQFDSAVNNRIHTQSLMDKEVQYYFTLFGALSATSGLFLQLGSDILVTLGAIHLFILVLLIAGYRLVRRITTLSGMQGIYEAQAALIRRWFIEIDGTLRHFIILPIASENAPAHPFMPVSNQMSMKLMPLFNSLLLACAFSFFMVEAHIYWERLFVMQFWIVAWSVAGVLSSALGVIFLVFQRRIISNNGDKFSSHVTEVVHEMLRTRSQVLANESETNDEKLF